MIIPKFKVGQTIFAVDSDRIVKVYVKTIIRTEDKDGEKLSYVVVNKQYKPDGSEKLVDKQFPEAYLVGDFETAKQSALANLKLRYDYVYKMLTNLTKENYAR